MLHGISGQASAKISNCFDTKTPDSDTSLKLITKLADPHQALEQYYFSFQEKGFDRITVNMGGKAGKGTQEGK